MLDAFVQPHYSETVPNYGFVIDQRKCVDCHACTVACKMENEVPLGVFRTWVKYIEKGDFPNTRRHFSVMRCNHCEDAPCVAICPTSALFVRGDGIVDFDNQRCIGCKSCMLACPYDAIYLHPDEHTAAKCNYCAHRVDVGLQPACVLVCPVQAIVSGDLDDPTSTISRLVAREPIRARKPEQGTKPKLFYLGADEASLLPEATLQPTQYIWSEVHPDEQRKLDLGRSDETELTRPHVVYNVGHELAWGKFVSGYLWTKSVAAGCLIVAGALLAFQASEPPSLTIVAPALALLFLLLTTALLVADLGKPQRFLYILTKPNFSSWLVWGSYILVLFGAVGNAWLIASLMGLSQVVHILAWPGMAAGILAAAYSGFLFGQAEGRDFWQTPMAPVHLAIQAIAAGSSVLLLAGSVWDAALEPVMAGIFAGALLLHAALAITEVCVPHANLMVAQTSRLIFRGPFASRYWAALLAGAVIPSVAAAATFFAAVPVAVVIAASLLALAGLWMYESIWVEAGQAVPLS